MSLVSVKDLAYGFVDLNEMKALGKAKHDEYVNAQPYPHIVLDDFIDEALLDQCLELFPSKDDLAEDRFERPQEYQKFSFNPDLLVPPLRSMFYAFNARPFLAFLENLTGIEGLIPDPYYLGGGFHETRNGGHLDVHADFNHHKKMDLERRINLLIYLNKDWKPEYGGAFELWDEKMEKCHEKVEPLFNRCAIFNTTSHSYHGHPDPVNHPNNQPRRSIALYYYTATWDGSKRGHTTQFRARTGTEDKFDYQVWLKEILEDTTPPILMRALKKLKK